MSSGRRRGRGSHTPFRAWGLLFSAGVLVLAVSGNWGEAGVAAAVLVFYLLAVRLARCRVETLRHRPCLWRVRGLLGTCDYHVGYKRGLPILVSGGKMGLPMFMWQREQFSSHSPQPERQPQPNATINSATAQRARRAGYDWVMMGLAAIAAAVTLVGVLRDFIAA